MDDRRFDDLARAMTGVASRRTMVRRLAAAALGALGAGRGVRALAQDDEETDVDQIDVHAGNGGGANAGAGGGDVVGGNISTGGNTGDTVTVGDTVAGEGDATVTVGDDEPVDPDNGDATVIVEGGDVTTTTELDVSADGGTAQATANGGSNNVVDVETVVVVDPCEGVVCSQCQTCDPETGTCIAAREGGACRNANACTTGDTCQGGVCVAGNRQECDQCFACDPDTGKCRAAPGATCTVSINGTPTPGVCTPFSQIGIVCCPGGGAFVRLAHARRAMMGR